MVGHRVKHHEHLNLSHEILSGHLLIWGPELTHQYTLMTLLLTTLFTLTYFFRFSPIASTPRSLPWNHGLTNQSSILKVRDITLPTKVHLVKAMVFPVVMYGCESWTIKKTECWRNIFKLWCWRRLLRVPWTERSHQSILKEINPEYSLEGLILKLKLQYL